MRALSLVFVALLFAAGCAVGKTPSPTLEGCQPVHAAGHEAVGPGPLRLERVVCHGWKPSSFTQSPPRVSPDGSGVAGSGYGTGLFLAPMEADAAFIELADQTGGAMPFDGPLSYEGDFAWRADSDAIWTSRQERMRPAGGWALGPVRPVLAQGDGRVVQLPELTHAAGPLDALLWLNGEGIALAQFGTRGSFYRPEHDDPAPTLAFVDARHGRVLDVFPNHRFPGVEHAHHRATGMVLPDGRAKALLRSRGEWIVWTQDEAPRAFTSPYAHGDRHVALSPDGRTVLVSLDLPTTTICPRIPPCRIGPPVTGPVAALHDLRTGRRLWSLTGTAVYGTFVAAPAFSPDGRLLLVGLPPVEGKAELAVLDPRSGRVLQRVGAPAGGSYSMGFTADGRRAWVSTSGITFFYEVRPPRA